MKNPLTLSKRINRLEKQIKNGEKAKIRARRILQKLQKLQYKKGPLSHREIITDTLFPWILSRLAKIC